MTYASTARTAARAPAVAAVGLRKSYGTVESEVHALRGVDLRLGKGAFTAIMGPSGSGKSTLLHCLAGLDSVTAGSVWLGDAEISAMSEAEVTRVRRERMGFIFQGFNLLPTLNAHENILLPLRIASRTADPALFERVVDTVGLRDRLDHHPSQLSGGQQQRVAVARALVSNPEVIFADEPTGNLDSNSGADVLGFLRASVDRFAQTIVMVTHDAGAASYADRVIFVRDGHLVHQLERPTPHAVLDVLKNLES